MKVLIVEDEDLFADRLEMLVEKLNYEHLATVDNSKDALSIIAQTEPDLILMDVHIQGDHDGIELADIIHKDLAIPIIFITSMQDDLTFKRASRTNPVRFLLKPFDNVQLQRTIELCVKQLAQPKEKPKSSNEDKDWESDFLYEDYFFIKTRQRLDKVSVQDVAYLEADGHYCNVHTKDKKFLVRISSTELAKRLPEALFFQTHRSYWVNVTKVDSVDLQNSVVIVNTKEVPLSKRSREALLKRLDWI